MIWSVLLACSQPETQAQTAEQSAEVKPPGEEGTADPASGSTDDWPTADQILLAHNRATAQCSILDKESYVLTWMASMDDGHQKPRVEQIVHQGVPGFSYTRIHQRREPNVRFAAFGRTPKGKFWSASDGGVQPDLPEELSATLMAGMDPTPVCNFEKRWPKRELVAPEDRDGTPTWHLKVSWIDGTSTDLWFHREHSFLIASEAKVGEVVTLTTLKDYQDINGVKWPSTEIAERSEGPLKITTTQTLMKLDTNVEGYAEIGPSQVTAALSGDAPAK